MALSLNLRPACATSGAKKTCSLLDQPVIPSAARPSAIISCAREVGGDGVRVVREARARELDGELGDGAVDFGEVRRVRVERGRAVDLEGEDDARRPS